MVTFKLYKLTGVTLCFALALTPCGCATSPSGTNNDNDLVLAAKSGKVKEVSRLLAKGADVNAKDKDGHTPLNDAIRNGYDDVAEVLRQHGGK
jgi:ankyrin repeat protein